MSLPEPEIKIVNKTNPKVKHLDTIYELSNGDTIHVHNGGDVWLYKGDDVETARFCQSVDDAITAAQE